MAKVARGKRSATEFVSYTMVLAALLILMQVLGFLGILNRNFGWDLSFVSELVTGVSIWLTFLGIGQGLVDGLHVRVSAVSDHLRGWAKRAHAWLVLAIWGAFFGVLAVTGATAVQRSLELGATTLTLHWPSAIFESAIPLGGVVGIIIVVQLATRLAKGRSFMDLEGLQENL